MTKTIPLIWGCILIWLPNLATAQVYGDWTVDTGQGYAEHIVSSKHDNTFTITCDEAATGKGEPKKTSISVEIAGKAPRPKTIVDVSADDMQVRFATDTVGSIPIDCRACSDDFRALWRALRRSKILTVRYADGRGAVFRLRGAARALSSKPCATRF